MDNSEYNTDLKGIQYGIIKGTNWNKNYLYCAFVCDLYLYT